jgi:hypothetical protein
MFFEKMGSNMDRRSCFSPKSCSSRIDLSNELSCTPKRRSYAKVTTPGKLMYQLPPSGPTNFWRFIFLGLGFWMSRFWIPYLLLKRP